MNKSETDSSRHRGTKLATAEPSQGALMGSGKVPGAAWLEAAAPSPGEVTHVRKRREAVLQC